ARRVLLPEQPVGHLRAAGEAEPHPAVPAGPRVRLPRASGRRQRRASLLRGDAEGHAGGQGRPGPHADRGVHLPHGAHTTTDDPTRYRLASELEMWKLKDPIERVRAYLVRGGMAEADFFAAVDAEAKQVGARVREACRIMPDPPPLSLFDHVYAE